MNGIITVSKGFVYRGPRVDVPSDYGLLQISLGIKTVLNLESGFFEVSRSKLNSEFTALTSLGMIPLHLEMSWILPPTIDEIEAAYTVLLAPKYCPVYVHCKMGLDRTGVVIAAYRVLFQGWSVDDAVQEMLDLGFHYWYFWWLPKIKENLTALAKKHLKTETV
jgi:tyrosine-protein phosphatase SIW14